MTEDPSSRPVARQELALPLTDPEDITVPEGDLLPGGPTPPPALDTTTAAGSEAGSSSDPQWRWWFALFLITFILFTVVVLVLLAQGQDLMVAVGVPASLSGLALGVLSRLAVLARRRDG
ncbi:hypothetical protein [Nonomuraea sp. NPDC049625]|uniref:hypothetical protein n=1 Tax=Nonomuraea sp. NPDC049625 TaxID=3155775 RepID=UPI0034120FE1